MKTPSMTMMMLLTDREITVCNLIETYKMVERTQARIKELEERIAEKCKEENITPGEAYTWMALNSKI